MNFSRSFWVSTASTSDPSISAVPAAAAAVPAVLAVAEACGSWANDDPTAAAIRPPAAISVDPVEYCVSGGTYGLGCCGRAQAPKRPSSRIAPRLITTDYAD